MARKSLSKKIRFEVFKRDGFVCQYCGNSPPSIILEVDHIKPVKDGGENEIDNLLTSCFDCNRGKGATRLEILPDTLDHKRQLLEEKREQLEQYEKLIASKRRALNRKVSKLEHMFEEVYEHTWKEMYKKTIRDFLEVLPYEEVESAVAIACDRITDPRGSTKYICGICWNKIRDIQDAKS
ncbi:HNH endonuclease [Candidatus Pacearchaeota archaeon]|nr:HNH endonuclease [Candidatus Pacearchaeota archaeon]